MKILIADDHALFRDALSKLIEELDSTAVVVQTSGYDQALRIIKNDTRFDMIIVDLEMHHISSWEQAINELKSVIGSAKLVIISASENPRNIRASLEKGISGYISKRSESKVIQNALKLILEGGTYIPPAALSKSTETGDINGSKNLTARQSQVLNLVAQGMSNKQIAYEIGVSEATVKLHINALLRSVGATNRTQAVITAQKMGII